MLGGDAHPAPPDGGGHGVHSLVLPDDMLLQPLLQLGQTLELLFLDLAGGDLGPQLDDPWPDVLHGQLRRALAASSSVNSSCRRSSWLRSSAMRA